MVFAAFLAATERPFAPLVRTAFFAAAERDAADRWDAARLACADNDLRDAERGPSRRNAFKLAFARFGVARFAAVRFTVARLRCDVDLFELALLRDAFFFGTLMPARRALDKPIAMACSVERAPCFPSRTCSIYSRTNSPA